MQKLELTWIGKGEQINPEPRILIEKPEHAYGDADSGNMLIHGDNLLALKSLQQDFAGMVKCIYIDPPYNTGSAFEHYDDNLEHSTWLSLMKPRLELLRALLHDEGFIFVQIDNYEMAYLKVLMDEVFGRHNHVNTIIWKRRGGSANPKDRLNDVVDYILWYAKCPSYQINHIFSLEDEHTQQYIKERFNNVDENGRQFMKSPIQSPNYRENLIYDYKGYKTPAKGYSISRDVMEQWDLEGRLAFPKSKSQNINRKIYLDEYKGQPISSLWTDIKVINPMSKERLNFDGQKPEAIIERVFTLTTNEGDLVLDSFLGSGTTAAVAHKMRRRWIGIELGNHAYTHCIPRLKAVVDGEQGGISKAVNWQGGGGFKVYELAPTLLETDEHGVLELSSKYNEEMLAQAMAKHEGYTYAPDGNIFWKQGYSGDSNFIFTTTAYISPKYLDNIASGLSEGEYLLICAESFDRACIKRHKNITVSPIPKMLLGRCEWGKDNYDLNIIMQDVTNWAGPSSDDELLADAELGGDCDE